MAATSATCSTSSPFALPKVFVSLSSQQPPLPDGLNFIRCCCRRGCRRRCPVGRRMPCIACLTPVCPCCGRVARYASNSIGKSPLDFVVCHACRGPMAAADCQRNDSPSDFQDLPPTEGQRWRKWEADLLWKDFCADVEEEKRRKELMWE